MFAFLHHLWWWGPLCVEHWFVSICGVESWAGWTLLPQLHPLLQLWARSHPGTLACQRGAALQTLFSEGKKQVFCLTRTPPAVEDHFSKEETEAERKSSSNNHVAGVSHIPWALYLHRCSLFSSSALFDGTKINCSDKPPACFETGSVCGCFHS